MDVGSIFKEVWDLRVCWPRAVACNSLGAVFNNFQVDMEDVGHQLTAKPGLENNVVELQ